MRRSVPMEKWIEMYVKQDAYWVHDGVAHHPHALLTKGGHSDGFFFSKPVVDNTTLRVAAADELVSMFADFEHVGEVDCVVGPQTGATLLAKEIAEQIGCMGGDSDWASPFKVMEGEKVVRMEFPPEQTVRPEQLVLLVEDVITTGGSIEQTVQAVERAGGRVLPYVLALVNRSGETHVGGRQVIALIEQKMNTWAPDVCPLCAGGSKAISPKRPEENWALLTKPT